MKLHKALNGALVNHLPLLVVILMQVIGAGMGLLSKAALNDGMNSLVINTYRQALSALLLAPFAFFLERKNNASLSFPILCKIFLVALCGPTVNFNVYFFALRLTTATFGSAIYNTIPVITFIIALLLRLEAVSWRSFYGGLKIVGMITAVGGAMVLSFYRGPPLEHSNTSTSSTGSGTRLSFNESENIKSRILTPVLMFIGAITYSVWLILQAKVLKLYPARLRLSTLQWLISTVQTAIVALALERNLDSWKIGWNIQLAFLAYGVVVVCGIQYTLQAWCVEKKGPFFVAMFYPLGLLITAIFSRFAWNERLSCGSLLGAILIVGGLYCVLWGRSKENNQVIPKTQPPESNQGTLKCEQPVEKSQNVETP